MSIPACGVDEAAQGDAAQQRLSLVKPKAQPELPSAKTPKVDVSQQETPEQRLRRLANEGTRDNCLEMLQQALGASSHEYRESDCSLKFKKGASQYIQAYLNNADATIKGGMLTFTCRSDMIGGCVNNGSTPIGQPPPKTTGWHVNPDADAAALQRCLDFLHERCKEM
ncbi:MAG: hypothetical protein H6713_07550 [Myxococcales bacterium]|nr:hypothetical protein [Myxococcales bacterium]